MSFHLICIDLSCLVDFVFDTSSIDTESLQGNQTNQDQILKRIKMSHKYLLFDHILVDTTSKKHRELPQI